MLKIINSITNNSGTLVIDEFVPFSFRVFPSPRPDPFLWRTGDLERNLFEAKIDRDTGELFAATLVTFAGTLSQCEPAIHSPVEIVEGLPLVDLSQFSSMVIDDTAPLAICRFERQIWIHFGYIARPTKCFHTGRAKFLTREETLVGIGCTDLSVEETGLLDESLSSSF
jgi:hypothetical protein